MPVFLRTADRKYVHVPEEDVNRHLLSGEISFTKGDTVPVRTRDGRYFMVPAEKAAKAISQGQAVYDFEAARLKTRRAQEQAVTESMGNLEAFTAPILGFTDVATLGAASSLRENIAYAMGGEPELAYERQRTQTVREQFPKLTLGGEALASFLPLEGLGAGAKLGRTAGEAISQALVKKGTGELARKALAKTTERVVQNTIEGGIIGGQAALTDIALGRTNDYTEHFVGSVGFGGLLGGGIAAGLSLPGLGVAGLKGGIASMWERATGERMQSWAYDKWSKMVKSTSDVPEDALKFFEGAEGKKMAALATASKEELAAFDRQAAGLYNRFVEADEAVANAITGPMKVEAIRGIVPKANAVKAGENLAYLMTEATQNAEALAKELTKLGRGKGANTLKKELKALSEELSRLTNPENRFAGPLGPKDMGGNYLIFGDKLKRVLWDGLGKVKLPYGNARAAAHHKGLADVLTVLRDHLEDAAVYGEGARFQKEINDATTMFLGYRGKLVPKVSEKTVAFGGRRTRRYARESSFLGLTESAAPDAFTNPNNRMVELKGLFDSHKNLAEVASKYYPGQDIIKARKLAESAADDFGVWFKEAVTRGKAIDQMKKLAGAHSPLAGIPSIARMATNTMRWGGLGVGVAFGSAPVALAWVPMYAGTKVLEAVVQPVKMIKLLGAIERRRVLNGNRVAKAIKGSLTKERFSLRPIEKIAVPSTVLGTRFVPRPEGRPRKDVEEPSSTAGLYRARLRELAILSVDPERVGQAIWKGAERHPELPSKFMIGAQVLAHRITSYLLDTAPKPKAGLMNDSWEPDPGELAAWTRRVDTVNDPVGVLERALGGMVTQEELDTLTVCFPSLYDQMRQAVMMSIGPEDWPKMPYDLRVALGGFLNMPTDPSLQPQFVGQMLKQYEEALTAPPSVAGLPKRDQMGRFASKKGTNVHERAAVVTEKYG
jgi:hypothetical protein